MTAIAALWYRASGRPAAPALAAIHDALAPYGGDRSALWAPGAVGLVTQQSATLPEDAYDCEPRLHGDLALAADVRLDNRDELVARLGIPRSDATVLSDSAILRSAWERWGAQCVQHLVGPYAFIAWSPARRELFCACDPLGRRRLFYAVLGDAVVVASMPAGILALEGFDGDLDLDAVARRLVLVHLGETQTYFKHISHLPAGHALNATVAAIRVKRVQAIRTSPIRYRRDSDYTEHFRELLAEAVRCRLRAPGGVASTLSSGLDSGTVTATAAEILAGQGQRLLAVTWRPRSGAPLAQTPGRLLDEGPAAAAIAACYPNIDHVCIEAQDQNPIEAITIANRASNQPTADSVRRLYLAATGAALRARRLRVALDGTKGNLTVSYDGMGLLAADLMKGRFWSVAKELVALRRTRDTWRQALGPLLVRLLPRQLVLWRGGNPEIGLRYYRLGINPAFADDYRVHQLLRLRVLRMDTPSRWLDRILTPRHLPAADWAAYGYESRDPTADRRLVEFCLSIPRTQFLQGGETRRLIKHAMRGRLPSATLEARSRGQQVADWHALISPHLGVLTRRIDEFEGTLAAAVLDLSALRRLVTDWPAQPLYEHWAPYQFRLMPALSMGDFLLQFGSLSDAVRR